MKSTGLPAEARLIAYTGKQPGPGEHFNSRALAGDSHGSRTAGTCGSHAADDVGPAAEFFVQPFLGVVRPDLPPVFFREAGEREDIAGGVGEMRSSVGDRSSWSTIRECWAVADFASGCTKIVRTNVATIACALLGTFVSRFRQ